MKKTVALIMAVCLCLCFCGCTDKNEPAKNKDFTLNIYCLNGPTGMGMAKLMEKSDAEKTKGKYAFKVCTSADQVTSQIISGNAHIAAVPTNLASVLYSKTGGKIQTLCVNALGVLYLLDTTGKVTSVKDLAGKTVYMTGQAANPEYVFDYLLQNNGINPQKDIKIVFVSDNQELASFMATGKAEICVAPQPVATVIQSKADVKNAVSFSEEWEKVTKDSALMMGCLVAQKSVIEEHPKEVEQFLAEYENSVKKVKESPENAAPLMEKYGIVSPAAIAKAAIPKCGLAFVTGKEMQTELSGYLQVLYDANPASVGGKIPAGDFWYEANK